MGVGCLLPTLVTLIKVSGNWFNIQVKIFDGRLGFEKASGEVTWTLPTLLQTSKDKLERIAPAYAQFKRKWDDEAGVWSCKRTGFKQGYPFDCISASSACYSNNVAYLELFLLAGGSAVQSESGKSLMHFASAGDSLECARILIDHSAYLDCLDSSGYTPVAIAVQANSLEVLRLLIFEGARLDLPTPEGTLLHTAARFNSIQAGIVLVYAGVSTTQKNAKGESPIDLAAQEGLLDFEISVQQAARSLFYSTSTRKPEPPGEYELSQPCTADTTRHKPSMVEWFKSLGKQGPT